MHCCFDKIILLGNNLVKNIGKRWTVCDSTSRGPAGWSQSNCRVRAVLTSRQLHNVREIWPQPSSVSLTSHTTGQLGAALGRFFTTGVKKQPTTTAAAEDAETETTCTSNYWCSSVLMLIRIHNISTAAAGSNIQLLSEFDCDWRSPPFTGHSTNSLP